MADRISLDAHEIALVGTTTRSLRPVPRMGTWEIVGHAPCTGDGHRKALTPGEPAPLCPACAIEVTWQLTHLAPTAAGDLQGDGPFS